MLSGALLYSGEVLLILKLTLATLLVAVVPSLTAL